MYQLKDYLYSINQSKKSILDDDIDAERAYPPYIVNRCLSSFTDTILYVNEMNKNSHLPKKLQYDFLLNTIRSKKRYAPWVKADKLKDLEYVKEYFGYSNAKAKAALQILDNEQITTIKNSLNKGGRK